MLKSKVKEISFPNIDRSNASLSLKGARYTECLYSLFVGLSYRHSFEHFVVGFLYLHFFEMFSRNQIVGTCI